jgi:pantoate--beta-alanine ligase
MQSTATSVKISTTIAETRAAVAKARAGGARIGLVPTMGALHAGHLSLVDRSHREADFTVMSIFVNPLQFGPGEDLARYPRPVAEDEQLASESGVDLIFRPDVSEMYDDARTVAVTAGPLGSRWEGASRPGHFDGVLTVVAKLFNIVQPDVAVFGQKDLQQAALVTAMVRDLDMPLRIVVSPIVREADGVALSSRNRYLSAEERLSATTLSRALRAISARFDAGERNTAKLEDEGKRVIAADPGVSLDYLAIIDRRTFQNSDVAQSGNSAIIAARVGSTRLIDNMTLGRNDQD